MTKHTLALTPLMGTACEHAASVLAAAIQAVDDALGEDQAAIQFPGLVEGYMTAAGNAYVALTIRDAVDAFLDGQEALRWRDNRDPCRQ
jgi:hypothetical protein